MISDPIHDVWSPRFPIWIHRESDDLSDFPVLFGFGLPMSFGYNHVDEEGFVSSDLPESCPDVLSIGTSLVICNV